MLKYRHTTIEDVPKLNEWVAADPIHKDLFTGEHFILKPDDKGMQCIEVLDDLGTVFYLKFTNALIVEAQFPERLKLRTFGALRQQLRISKGLKEALGFFMFSTKKLGYHALFFNSVSGSLIQFFEKLGFSKLTDYFKVDL